MSPLGMVIWMACVTLEIILVIFAFSLLSSYHGFVFLGGVILMNAVSVLRLWIRRKYGV